MADIELAIRQRALLRGVLPEDLVPEERRRDPELIYAIARNILEDRILLADGERLDLLPTGDEILAAWQTHESLREVHEMPELEREQLIAELGLAMDDLYHLITLEIVAERWLDLVEERITSEQMRDDYIWRNTTVTVQTVEIPNIPSNGEIEEFINDPTDPGWFDRYYRDHLSQYRLPASRDVRVVTVRFPADSTEATREAARAEAEALRGEVLAGGDMVVMSTERSDHPVAERGGVMHRSVRRQLPDAFDLDEGEIGSVVEGQLGFEFYRVEAEYGAEYRPLEHTLRREIASTYLSQQAPLPAPSELAESVRQAMLSQGSEELTAMIREHRLVTDTIGPIRREPDGMVAGVGIAPQLQANLFNLSPETAVTSQYYLVNRRLFVAKLIDRHLPTDQELEANRAELESEYRARVRRTAWDAYWAQLEEENPIVFEMPAEYLDDTKDER